MRGRMTSCTPVRCDGHRGKKQRVNLDRRFVKRRSPWRSILVCLLAFAIGCVSVQLLDREVHVVAAESEIVDIRTEAIHTGGIEPGAGQISGFTGRKVMGDGTTDGSEEIDNLIKDTLAAMVEDEFAEAPRERRDILVVLDSGHGGDDEGCSRKQILEKDINLQIAKAAESRLLELGYQVMCTRSDDSTLTLEQRVDMANRAGADVYISIHQNACEEEEAAISGIETWYNETKGDAGSRRLAQLIHSDVLLYSQAEDRGIIADEDLRVIRETNMPACLVETGFLSNKREREMLCEEEYQDRLAEGIVSGIDLYFFPKMMYLTFDDGPTEGNTAVILDILKKYNIRATFFMVGENVEKHPEMARRVAEEGHTIGIHCYNHDYTKLYASVDSYVQDFEKAREVVYEATGVDARLFRFPGGSINSYNKAVYKDIIEEMTDRGYIYFDWSASLEDATKHNEPERLLKNAKESTFGRRRVVMLAHDTVYNTTQCLEELIEQFPEYRMLPLDEDVEPVHF